MSTGLERLMANITNQQRRLDRAISLAAREVGDLIEGYARTHTGKGHRPGRWITRPGLSVRKHARVRDVGATGGYRYPANSNKVWRPPGAGWGDVTGHLRKTIKARVRSGVGRRVDIVLSANTPYAPRLELGHGGKYRWLGPAVMENRGRIVQIINRRARVR